MSDTLSERMSSTPPTYRAATWATFTAEVAALEQRLREADAALRALKERSPARTEALNLMDDYLAKHKEPFNG